MDNVIKVNIVNFITVGLMSFVFIYIVNYAATRLAPGLALGRGTASSSGTSQPVTSPLPTVTNTP
jgi:hypothetical protein